ncbi:MAG: hypothetical protein HPY83_14635 [Anaerolineae bacterium]|nr:hypothetical protein [Anaerolineae bacterium]
MSVSCRSEYTYAQEPLRIQWSDGRQEDVARVLGRSIVPQGRRFVVSAGGRRVELLYREAEGLWLARETAIREA